MALLKPITLITHIISYIIFLFACFMNVKSAHAATNYSVVDLNWLQPRSECLPSTQGANYGSQKLKVTYSYGPCSPFRKGNKVPSSDQILLQDMSRVNSINARITRRNPTKQSSVAVHDNPNKATDNGNYIITVGFGTPRQDQKLILDTGSDITWIQCKPYTKNSYTQDGPLFDPSLSSSYKKGPCSSSGQPDYSSHYADGSYSNGLSGCDTLSLKSYYTIPKFQFGCSQESGGDFGKAAGILGLGQGDLSIVSQTSSNLGNIFVYCFPSSSSSSGHLLFGDEAKSLSASLKFTPMLKHANSPSNYFLSLDGISVAGKRLEISPAVFSSTGTIIDSGTVITRLPESAYSALRTAFQESMKEYPLLNISSTQPQLLDTCYNLGRYETANTPTVVMHFGGGTDVNIRPSGVLWGENKSNACLAFAAKKESSGVNIIGNVQQRALNVLYDIEGGRIGFGSC